MKQDLVLFLHIYHELVETQNYIKITSPRTKQKGEFCRSVHSGFSEYV